MHPVAMPPQHRFRRVYRSFDEITYDPRKSEEVFAERGFDLAYISRMFPGYVLEREDTRPYPETRYQVIGAIAPDIYFVVYTRSVRRCRLITAWEAGKYERKFWYDAL